MSRRMFSYISEEAGWAQDLVSRRKELTKPFVEAFAARVMDRVFMLGSGSSRHAALIAQPFVEDVLGVETTVCMPSRADGIRKFSTGESLLVLISQGGHSTNTIAASRNSGLARESILAVTEAPTSPVAQEAGIHIKLPWDEPEAVGAKTKGVVSSAVIVMLCALELALAKGKIGPARYDAIIEAFRVYAENHAENVRRVAAWVAANAQEMKDMPALLILSQNAYLGAGLECALKMLETIYRPVTAYEFEEYLHGVGNSIGANNNFLLALMPKGEDCERMQRLYRFAKEQGSTCYAVFMGAEETGDGREVSLISSGCDYVDTLIYLLPGQILSSDLSEVCGYDIEKSRFKGFSAIMNTKA